MKRVIAHLVFGFSLGGVLGKIPLYNDFPNSNYWAFVVFCGFLFSIFAEFCQWSWNDSLKPYDGHKFQNTDVAKNFGSSLVGSAVVFFLPLFFWPSLVILVAIVGYAVYCIINKKAI